MFKQIFGCANLTSGMHLAAVCCGVGSLVVAALVKLTPVDWNLAILSLDEPDEQKSATNMFGKQITQSVSEVWKNDPR